MRHELTKAAAASNMGPLRGQRLTIVRCHQSTCVHVGCASDSHDKEQLVNSATSPAAQDNTTQSQPTSLVSVLGGLVHDLSDHNTLLSIHSYHMVMFRTPLQGSSKGSTPSCAVRKGPATVQGPNSTWQCLCYINFRLTVVVLWQHAAQPGCSQEKEEKELSGTSFRQYQSVMRNTTDTTLHGRVPAVAHGSHFQYCTRLQLQGRRQHWLAKTKQRAVYCSVCTHTLMICIRRQVRDAMFAPQPTLHPFMRYFQ